MRGPRDCQLKRRETSANSLRTWVKPVIPDLYVAPKQEIALDFTIDVPMNADPGSHWGTLLRLRVPFPTRKLVKKSYLGGKLIRPEGKSDGVLQGSD
jgi:hypothetical protein